ncbi:MAG: cupin domain-containing protein [Pikeienuella sp.]
MTGPVVHLDDITLRDWRHGEGYAAKLGRIGGVIGAKQLGCQLHILPPGKAAFPRHFHHVNEEMYIVLEGTGTFDWNGTQYPVRQGSICAAPAGGPETARKIWNSGDTDLVFLCVSTRRDPDVCEYPDSGKFMVASGTPDGAGLLQSALFFMGRRDSAVDYWDGEDQ